MTDQLVSIDDGLGTTLATYTYDPFGRRLSKDVMGQKTFYFYTNEGLTAELDNNGVQLRGYGWAPGSMFGTDPLWLKENGNYYWFQNDHRGAPWKLTDSTGIVVWQGNYNSFGQCTVQINTVTNNLRFPGQYYDYESGLHYNLHRYYDPETGRYLQLDPARDGLNGYAYVYGNPMAMTDPYGLCAMRSFSGGAAMAAGLTAALTMTCPLAIGGGILMAAYGAHELYGGLLALNTGENFDLIGDGWNSALPNHPNLAAAATFASHMLIPYSAAKMITSGLCFARDTPILTKDGEKLIQDLDIDDVVASFDPVTGKTHWRKVTRLFRRQGQEVLSLTIANEKGETEELIVTPEHPFWKITAKPKWTVAQKLEAGDILGTFDGKEITVVSVKKLLKPTDVYNFEVEEYHTYFVGGAGVCVHNVCGTNAPNWTNSKTANQVPKKTSGIYEFTDAMTGQQYVGQSKNIVNRLKQHIKKGKLAADGAVDYLAVKGDKFAREVAEQFRINHLTENFGAGSDLVSNVRNPIGKARLDEMARLLSQQ